ncbi:MAG TPA: right-handed parallel beta-helix repeat-containing protein [Candidatus Saccharimonadia bacterium]|nr:right-handed parallel beta-helix repeat-containing protein [Candidatus Saccharimonadia bacterium]
MAVYILGSTSGFGQATRTWVSGVGDDANPCSRTAPCKTFAGAISKTAASGEINVLDPGGFGGVTITKAMTIDGSGGSIAGVLVSGTTAIIINAGANDVVALRNIKLNGVGTGTHAIRILAAKAVYIEDCEIYNFANNGIIIENTAAGNIDVFIKNTRIRNVNPTGAVAGGNGAVTVRPGAGATASVTVENSSMEFCNYGIRVEDRGTLTAKGCFSGNHLNHGYIAVGSATVATINLENCVASNNKNNAASSGVQSFGAFGTVRLSNSTIFSNQTGIICQGGATMISFGNNRINGNTTNATGAPTLTTPSL